MVPGSDSDSDRKWEADDYEISGHISESNKDNCCARCGTEKSADTNAAHWESSGKCRCFVGLPSTPTSEGKAM